MSNKKTLNERIKEQLQAELEVSSGDSKSLNDSLRLLSKWRSVLISNTYLQHQGTLVMQGPLKDLDFLKSSAEGCHIAKLLGCYEQPLQPYIETAIETAYPIVLNIGCAEGYYAVGLARRMPNSQILAFDIDAKAQHSCLDLAAKNQVADRVKVGALFKHEDFATYSGQRVLVLCDIEGAESQLLDPKIAPSLTNMDLIVESHDCLTPGLTQLLIERFKLTHQITVVTDNGQRQLDASPDWFNNLSHLDQLLATWEWRAGPTPWLVMKANTVNAHP